MDPIQTKFYQASFEVECGGQELSLRGLFSEQGVTKIYLSTGLPDFWRGRLGKLVIVKIDTLKMNGVLLEQIVANGSFYEIRFRSLSEAHRHYLQQRIAAEGIAPGWKREFPRISVGRVVDPELPVPNLCMVRFLGQELFVNVLNFTLKGIRIETIGDQLAEIRVGALLEFDLLTSTGEVMANLQAEVRNISAHEATREGVKTITRSFGLRFNGLDPTNEVKYRKLIRDYCLALQKRLDSE